MSTRGFILAIIVVLSFSATNCSCKLIYISPDERYSCPSNLQQCYTLSSITNNVFSSNTKIVFSPGNHTIGANRSIVIANVSNITVEGEGSTLQCNRNQQIGLVFIQITNLSIKNLHLDHCGTSLSEKIKLRIYGITSLSTLLLHNTNFYTSNSPALYLIQVTNATISGVRIYGSPGPGLLGFNVIGHSTVTQSYFITNNPNCVFLFMDTVSNASVLSIHYSEFLFGTLEQNQENNNSSLTTAAGLSVIAAQSSYDITAIASNVIAHGNNGTEYGNILFRVSENNENVITIHLSHITCSHSKYAGLVVDIRHISSGFYNWKQKRTSILTISHSYFGQNTKAVVMRRFSSSPDNSVRLENITFHDNSLALWLQSTHAVLDNVNFTTNLAEKGISAPINIDNSKIRVIGNSTFRENKGSMAAVLIKDSSVWFEGNATFLRNEGERAGAIYSKGSQLHFQDYMQFTENEGYDGGAIAFYEGISLIKDFEYEISYSLTIAHNLTANFTRNHARHYGGAIYIGKIENYLDTDINVYRKTQRQKCFYIPVYDKKTYSFNNAGLMVLTNNTSGFAGSAIYGGWIKLCYIQKIFIFFWDVYPGFTFSNNTFQIEANDSDLSPVSSEPVRVCLCYNSKPICNITDYTIKAYPGETFLVHAVGVGQMYGTVPSSVIAQFRQTNTIIQPQFESLQRVQKAEHFCMHFRYTIKSSNTAEDILLTVESNVNKDILNDPLGSMYPKKQFDDVVLHVELQPCPLGFVMNKTFCTCHPHLQVLNIQCNITSARILRNAHSWINATFNKGGVAIGILVHQYCPFGYCKAHNLDLSLQNPDEQCALNRSGTLCGACQPNLSKVLGSSKCKHCSNFWLRVIINVTALAGLILVAFLMLLNFTISEGTISGLIFYANIVQANQAVFFPNDTKNTFLSWFIAWLNLDLGIETCFYSGMDAYAKTWLQFVFPTYTWLIMILTIMFSYYSTTGAKLAGRNAVQVLATLLLISYAKLLRVIFTVLSFTTLEYPDGSVRRVWLYDGNVDYLKGKHIPLFMAALVLFLVFFLPYTTLLLCIQCIRLKRRFWIRIIKLKPLFDAYTGTYKDICQFWTGILLLFRAILFLIFSANTLGDPAVNLLAIVATVLLLSIIAAISNGVYKIWYFNALEYTFMLNLGTLSAASLFTRITNRNQAALTYTSVIIAFISFCGIVLYHTIISFQKLCHGVRFRPTARQVRQDQERQPSDVVRPPVPQQVPVTFIQLQLHEPLIES